MKLTIKEMAELAGVTVRTLHYYDEIGLMTPSEVIAANGYRYYDQQDVVRLQQILFYRELDFPLKEIVEIMNTSGYNKEDALRKQRELLMIKRKRLNGLIKLLDASLKGDHTMSFQAFDESEMDQAREKYAQEVKERWGQTKAYEQNQQKTAGYKKEDWQKMNEGMDELLKQFAAHLSDEASAPEVQALVTDWQNYITNNYYDCTKEILAGLGQMYIADERFTKNMDRFGEGTTKLMSEAIAIYVSR